MIRDYQAIQRTWFLKGQQRIVPTYGKHEGLWKWLKSEVINNVFFSNVCQIQKAVRSFMEYIKNIPSVVIDRLCVQM